jgi:hypothetical protein
MSEDEYRIPRTVLEINMSGKRPNSTPQTSNMVARPTQQRYGKMIILGNDQTAGDFFAKVNLRQWKRYK